MALPARLVSKIGLLGLLLAACQAGPAADTTQRFVRQDDPALRQAGPVLLYQQTPLTGVVVAFYSNGDTLSVEPFRAGKLQGTAQVWHPNRRKSEERTYEAGRRVGLHQGWWASGQRRFRHAYADDLMEGPSESWFADGTPAQRKHYAEGHEAGRQILWQPNGRLLANYEVRNGRNYGLTGQNPCVNATSRVSF
ncbi:MAG: hypothetical protein LH606_18085 [Cytophagaceae bacterium]|nr:hypothetical protein [Cytophagaceae bacterium]